MEFKQWHFNINFYLLFHLSGKKMSKLDDINDKYFKKNLLATSRDLKKKKVFKEISGVPIVLLQVEILELHWESV